MHELTMTIIGRVIFGVDLSSKAATIRQALADASASVDPLLSLLAPSRRLRPARDRLRAFVDGLIDERVASRAQGDDDVLALLMRLEPEAHGPSRQLRDDVFTIFVAGHDTIANGLTWTWHLLATHPQVEARLVDEVTTVLAGRAPAAADVKALRYVGAVLSESLRLLPPSWVITREALQNHRLGDITIPAGAILVISQLLLHRDPRFFVDPLLFNPERWLTAAPARPKLAYLPFGAGPRACIGQGLAMMEGVLVLAAIAERWRLRPLGPIALDPRATLRPKGQVPMRASRRRG
jgi:cytochrome P450